MEVYLIGCHISNAEQLSLLRKLVDKLESNNKKFVLSSHTLLPDEIIKKSIGFVYDSVNPIYKTWDLDGKDKYCITTEFFQLWSKYISYGAPNYYHVGAIRLIQNGIRYIKSLDCKIVHWIEYDAEPLFMEEELNKKRLELCDFVFYGIGSKFSFNIDKVSEKFLSLRGEEVIKTLSNLNYVAEKLIDSYLIDGPKMFFDVEGKNEFMGKYSQFNKQKINWCFFEKDEALNLFILNKVNDSPVQIKVSSDENDIDLNLAGGNWSYFSINKNTINLKIRLGEELITELNLSDKQIYQKLVKDVIFKQL